MVDTPSSLKWPDVNELVRRVRGNYGVEVSIILTPSGTGKTQWRADVLASPEPIMKDGVVTNWWSQQEVHRATREGGENSYASLASMVYWTVDDLNEQLWQEMTQTDLPL